MRRELAGLIVLCTVLFVGCDYTAPDTPTDTAALPTVGFASPSTLVDENSDVVSIPVTLSEQGTAVVSYRVTGGNATRPADFTLEDGNISFLGATNSQIDVAIHMDALEEPDETIELELFDPSGATLGANHHTITISSDILPRVSIVGGNVSEDEAIAGTVTLHLDLAPKAPVQVNLSVAGSATAADYTVASQAVMFGVNETDKVIQLGVVDDALDEDNEGIDLDLTSPVGLVIDSSAAHATHTIQDNDAPPGIDFAKATQTNGESVADATQIVQLTAPSGKMITVQYAQTAGAAGGADVTVGGTGTLTFLPGDTMKSIPITVLPDLLDEANETATITLSNAVNATLPNTPDFTLTITDDDDQPTIGFTTATTAVTEGTLQITVTVTLSAPSGLPISIDFGATAASTATAGTDFTFVTASPLAFPAGTVSKDIVIDIANDAVAEADETIVIALTNPSNATLTGITTHTVTIADKNCLGTGNFRVCPSIAPTGTVTLTNISTTNDPRCQAQPPGWAAQGQDPVCIVIAQDIVVSATVAVSGTRPLILFASGTIDISGTLNASATTVTNGPGGASNLCANGTVPGNDNSGGGGGFGASFMSKGGDGGDGDNAGNGSDGGNAANADAADPPKLRPGCKGSNGGNGQNSNTRGVGGGGGGAVYLIAGGKISISGNIDVSGGGGTGGLANNGPGGGGGGGSGGMLLIEGGAVDATGTMISNGGGAGQGADNNTNGGIPLEPAVGQPNTPALGGQAGGAGGNGGNGFAGATAATSGANGGSGQGAGGGGGGGGLIKSNLAISGTASAGKVEP